MVQVKLRVSRTLMLSVTEGLLMVHVSVCVGLGERVCVRLPAETETVGEIEKVAVPLREGVREKVWEAALVSVLLGDGDAVCVLDGVAVPVLEWVLLRLIVWDMVNDSVAVAEVGVTGAVALPADPVWVLLRGRTGDPLAVNVVVGLGVAETV